MTSSSDHIQIDSSGNFRHFLSIEGFSQKQLQKVLDIAQSFWQKNGQISTGHSLLKGKTVANLFFENSTRTRSTFELAARHLGGSVLNLNISNSSIQKGESLLDTIANLEAMGINLLVIRHSASGAPLFVARHSKIPIINAGDGCHEHPTQAMLDLLTIRKHKPNFTELRVAIVGDILHSRVARSLIHALTIFGTPQIRVIAPKTLLPIAAESLGVTVYEDLAAGIKDVDVIVMLRLQEERMLNGRLADKQEYFHYYGLTEEKLSLAKPDVLVMHAGPINRGVELEATVADGPQSVILQQVQSGVAVRMAVMALLLNPQGVAEMAGKKL